MYEEGGWIPKWPNPYYSNDMIGTHSDSIITDAYLKGLRDFDINRAYEGMYKHATVEVTREMWDETPFEGRPMLNLYKEMGYIPADVQSNVGRKRKEQVSQTLEYAYDDWCLAQLAKALGKNSDHEMFLKRSKNYINVFDKSVGFVRGRTKAGDWVEPFDPKEHYDYLTEGNPWQYSWFAPQDIEGLINLMGGPELFVNKLDEFFQSGQYWHGNEPSHHIVYLYNYAGAPWKTQERVREIMGSEYKLIPAGLSGNDDAGQMSAWYVFSAMGFYPVTPGSNLYSIGTPLFDEVTIKLDDYYDNNKFRIIAINNSENNKYIQRAFLNGRLLDSPFISHEDIVKGGNLIFIMGSNPNKNWGVK
jgi:predicted alpha-1,2-mannosidase